MRISSPSVAAVGLLLGIIFCWSSAVVAAEWPHRAVRLIAPVPAGSASDFSARLFAEQLSQRWGQPVIVENRPGADGVIGVSAFLGTGVLSCRVPILPPKTPMTRDARLLLAGTVAQVAPLRRVLVAPAPHRSNGRAT